VDLERREKKMDKRYGHLTIALLFVAVLLLNIFLVDISPVHAQPPWGQAPREQTLWCEGYWVEPTSFCPAIQGWGQGWDTYVMYEPVFGMDVGSGIPGAEPVTIPWLGEKIEWLDSTTIKVTLRTKSVKIPAPGGGLMTVTAPYWVNITDWNAWVAGDTSVVQYYRTIDAYDVKFSYSILGAFEESLGWGAYWHMGGFKDRVGSIANFEVVDGGRAFKVHIKPGYEDSTVVWRSLLTSWVIVPYDIWSDIEEVTGTVRGYWNTTVVDKANPVGSQWTNADGDYFKIIGWTPPQFPGGVSGQLSSWAFVQNATEEWFRVKSVAGNINLTVVQAGWMPSFSNDWTIKMAGPVPVEGETVHTGAIGTWTSLAHNNIAPASESVKNSTGDPLAAAVDYAMDYPAGKIKPLTDFAANQDLTIDYTYMTEDRPWRVASGMFLPWKHQTTEWPKYSLMKKNPLWWGYYVLGREPAVEYQGNLNYPDNTSVYTDMHKTSPYWSFDWMGPYAPNIWEFEGWPDKLHTYLNNPPYFIDVINKALVPNHRRWPLGEPWLHYAITKINNFTALNAVTSYYCKEPSALLIPKDDTAARTLLNTTIENKYNALVFGPGFEPDVAAAINILKANAYYINSTGKIDQDLIDWPNGDWYTKDGPSISWVENYLEDNPELTVGTVTKTAQEWYANWETLKWEADQLNATVPGINVKLGPWVVIDVYGWTDINQMTILIARGVREKLDIQLNDDYPEYTTYESKMNSMDFDFSHYCMFSAVGSDLYDRYAQLYTGEPGAYSHQGDARNPEMETLLSQLDAPPAGKTRQDIANEMQEIFGRDLPVIPTCGHPDWYVYYTNYWVRQPSENHKLLPCSPYGGGGYTAAIQKILLSVGTSKQYGLEDINNDHIVDVTDIRLTAAGFLAEPGDPAYDLPCDVTYDNLIDVSDIRAVAAQYLNEWSW
jgi:hypothetical protein